MFGNIFLIFVVIKLDIFGTSDVYKSKIVKTNLRSDEWKLLEDEEQNHGLDLFSKHKTEEGTWDVIFKARSNAIDVLKNHNITCSILADDVNSLYPVDQERQLRRSKAVVNNRITFTDYLKLEEIMSYLENLPSRSNSVRNVSVESIGKTIENRDIMMVKIAHPHANGTVLFDAGVHAREWLSVMQALYLVEQIVQAGSGSNLTHVNWYIIPTLNPDGYTFSHSSSKYRLHRKNMNKKNCPSGCETCGVDLNRNFGYKYGVAGASTNPCSVIYRGENAFSEPESRALRDVLQKHAQNLQLYLSFHTFGRLILYPWGYGNKKCDDWRDLKLAATVARDAIETYTNIHTGYTVVHAGGDFYAAAGASDDYAKYLGIKYSYTMELQEGGSFGFDPSAATIKRFVEENFAGIAAMVEYIHKPYEYIERSLSAKPTNDFIMRAIPGNIIYSALYTVFND